VPVEYELVRSISVLSTGLPGGKPAPTTTPPPATGRGSENYLEDNAQAWAMDPEGGYLRAGPRRSRRSSAQEELLVTLATPS